MRLMFSGHQGSGLHGESADWITCQTAVCLCHVSISLTSPGQLLKMYTSLTCTSLISESIRTDTMLWVCLCLSSCTRVLTRCEATSLPQRDVYVPHCCLCHVQKRSAKHQLQSALHISAGSWVSCVVEYKDVPQVHCVFNNKS